MAVKHSSEMANLCTTVVQVAKPFLEEIAKLSKETGFEYGLAIERDENNKPIVETFYSPKEQVKGLDRRYFYSLEMGETTMATVHTHPGDIEPYLSFGDLVGAMDHEVDTICILTPKTMRLSCWSGIEELRQKLLEIDKYVPPEDALDSVLNVLMKEHGIKRRKSREYPELKPIFDDWLIGTDEIKKCSVRVKE